MQHHEFTWQNEVSYNVYRHGSVLGHRGKLELVTPWSKQHNFYPMILVLIKDQNEESITLAYELYSTGLPLNKLGINVIKYITINTVKALEVIGCKELERMMMSG